jgi:hypothetical protein
MEEDYTINTVTVVCVESLYTVTQAYGNFGTRKNTWIFLSVIPEYFKILFNGSNRMKLTS